MVSKLLLSIILTVNKVELKWNFYAHLRTQNLCPVWSQTPVTPHSSIGSLPPLFCQWDSSLFPPTTEVLQPLRKNPSSKAGGALWFLRDTGIRNRCEPTLSCLRMCLGKWSPIARKPPMAEGFPESLQNICISEGLFPRGPQLKLRWTKCSSQHRGPADYTFILAG